VLQPYAVIVTVIVELPDELADRLSSVATRQGTTLEQLALEAIEGRFPVTPTLSFIGVGASGGGLLRHGDHNGVDDV
jgi:hypothetical protein